MREAIGSSLLLNIVIVFIGVISAFLISSIAYSKAFKVKNRIVSVIEKYDGICFNDTEDKDNCYKEIEAELQDMGYSSNIVATCPKEEDYIESNDYGILSVQQMYPKTFSSGHKYCVYKYTLCDNDQIDLNHRKCKENSNEMYYYKVISFMHFDIPVIGQFLEFKVSGETKTFYNTFVNIEK